MSIKDHEIYMEANRLAVLATTAIERAMAQAGLRRSDLAARLGVPRSRVTKVLDGETNMTLRTLASFGLACGVRWQFLGTDVDSGFPSVGNEILSESLACSDLFSTLVWPIHSQFILHDALATPDVVVNAADLYASGDAGNDVDSTPSHPLAA